jgi:Dolichyl-phosphate-mannose-protein mannosyltransferase
MKDLLARLPRLPIGIGLLALALYLPGFWWGVPYPTAPDRIHSWGVDSPMPLGPLADVYNLIAPQPDRNLGYPLMHSFLVDAAYTPYLGYLWLTGRFARPSATYPYGLRDPVDELRVMTLIANFLSVLMGVGIAVAAYDAGKIIWGRRTGILSALFAMLSYPMFYYSRTGNVDVATLFFTALALDVYARCLAGGFTTRRAIWMGVFVGFAFGTKESSFASFLALPFVLLPLHWRSVAGKGNGGSWAFWKLPLIALASCCLAFGLGSGLFVGPERYFAHVEFARARLHFLAANHVAYLRSYPFTFEGNWELARLIAHYLVNSMTLAGLLLACLGVLWALWREPLTSAFALPAFTYAAVLFWSARTAELRYLMPVAFTLSFFAARAVVLAWMSHRRALRYGFALIAVGVVVLSLLRGVDLTYAMVKDSRYAAGKWLEPRTLPGARVDTFGPPADLPPLKAGIIISQPIQFVGVYRPRLDATAVKEIVGGWKERKPDFIVILPDYTSPAGAPYSRSCPLVIYRGLLEGTLGYRLDASFETPELLPWVRRPALDYPSVNPPIQIFARAGDSDFWAKQKAAGPGDKAARQR